MKIEEYRAVLRSLPDWEPYLLAESRLPGPRSNLELAQAAAEEGDERHFVAWLSLDPERAPANSPHEFLPVCGLLGLGRLVAGGRRDLLQVLRTHASDPRWRSREGVAMALQRFGRADMGALLDEMELWSDGSPLEQRAAAAALCEPALLRNQEEVERVLAVLDRITESLRGAVDRRCDAFRTLRQGLGYCWSVAVCAAPEIGKTAMERWLGCDDPDVRWVMKENLGKARLARMDAGWVSVWRSRLEGAQETALGAAVSRRRREREGS